MRTTTPNPTLRARVPVPMLAALTTYASRTGGNLSDALRELLLVGLTERGHWPPPEARAA